jgi:hypothetical protein
VKSFNCCCCCCLLVRVYTNPLKINVDFEKSVSHFDFLEIKKKHIITLIKSVLNENRCHSRNEKKGTTR